jgi:transposase InsO family protein
MRFQYKSITPKVKSFLRLLALAGVILLAATVPLQLTTWQPLQAEGISLSRHSSVTASLLTGSFKTMSEDFSEVAKQVPRADELREKQQILFSRNYLLVCLIKNEVPIREAINRVASLFPDTCRSERWAQKLYKRFEKHGVKALLDGRSRNKRADVLLTNEIKDLVLAWFHARPAAGPNAIWKKICEECQRRNIPTPGYDSIRKFLKSLPEYMKMTRGGKMRIHDKQARVVVRYNITSYSNERWQIDNSHLPIWAREKVNGEWQPCELWISAVLDTDSRSIPGLILSKKYPDSWTTSLLLRHAILPKENPKWLNKGLPRVLQPDRGKDFMSHAVAVSLGYLGIILDPDPPYYPNRKGKIERWFETLDIGCLRILPGHHAAIGTSLTTAKRCIAELLTRKQIEREIERWTVEDYHQRVHSETGRKPAELWRENVRLRMPESEAALDSFLLKSDTSRVVRNMGIDFRPQGNSTGAVRGGRYWAPELAFYVHHQVRLRYNPEDLESILVYDATDGKYICEAWLMGGENAHYTIADIKRCRSQFRRGLVERTKDYINEIKREDRRAARRAEMEEARVMAEAMPAPAPERPDPLREDVDALLEEFERQDRAG